MACGRLTSLISCLAKPHWTEFVGAPRFPTLICACFVLTAALLSFGIALVLDAVKKQSDQSFERALANA